MYRRSGSVVLCVMLSCGWIASAAANSASLLERGQEALEKGKYGQAIDAFSKYIDLHPTKVDGYRGRIEANLMLRRYSDCVRDYAQITARVIPVHPNAAAIIYAYYETRLQARPNEVRSRMALSFAHWWYFDYQTAIEHLNVILQDRPTNRYALLMRASSLLLSREDPQQGLIDLQQAISRDNCNPHVRFIAADAFTYGERDYVRAFAQAQLAFAGGLDTPRLHAILATCYNSFGETQLAAEETWRHITMVATRFVTAQPLASGDTESRPVAAGDVIVIPLNAIAGESIVITTDGPGGDVWDTILVLCAPDGTPVASADDVLDYYAALDWTASEDGTYHLFVTSFESVQTGVLTVTRW